MRTKLIKIGNSRGIRIPKLMLDETGLNGEVELLADANSLVIRPINGNEVDEGVLLSHSALAKEWESTEEDEAWASLQ